MPADPPGEIPSDKEFGARVIAAREAKGWTQKQLAARVGTSQPTISTIESGGSSALIPEVVRVLKIPGPMFGWSEQQKRWAFVGHKLEERSPATFRLAMTMIEQMLADLQPPPEQPDEPDAPPPPPAPKKARSIANSQITGFQKVERGRLRDSAESPVDKPDKSKR